MPPRRPGRLARPASLAALVALLSAGMLEGQGAPRKLAAAIERVFGGGVKADTLFLDGSPVLRLARGDSLLGYARVVDVRGKEQPITCLVAVDRELRIRDVDILAYREAYGGEVAYESWRKQFRGRGTGDQLEPGRDIRGISGATISVNAVTLGIRAVVATFAQWRAEGRL